MKKTPLVAVVGRPNVGKSTFFNRVAGRRISIVKDEPGVTRDRVYADAEWLNYNFKLIDTGGLDFSKNDDVNTGIIKQAQVAIDLADVILFFVDGISGLTSQDEEVGKFLRRSKKPVILVVNKIDNNQLENTYEFYALGFGDPIAISSELSKGLGDLLDEVVSHFGKEATEEEDEKRVKIAIVGRPNAGKSSLTNAILKEERCVVGAEAGTTRDAVDTPFDYNGKSYTLIDTAGIRKQRSVELNTIESYSVLRSFEAIRRSNVVILMIDAEKGVTEQDQRILGYVLEEKKPIVIVMNKWDLIEKDSYSILKFEEELKSKFSFINYYKSLFISAKTGLRVSKVLETADVVYENASRRIPTSLLNELLADAMRITQPPAQKGRRVKVYFGAQTGTNPPMFTLSVNDKRNMQNSYIRYLENYIRKNVDFSGSPIEIVLKNRSED